MDIISGIIHFMQFLQEAYVQIYVYTCNTHSYTYVCNWYIIMYNFQRYSCMYTHEVFSPVTLVDSVVAPVIVVSKGVVVSGRVTWLANAMLYMYIHTVRVYKTKVITGVNTKRYITQLKT